MTNNELAKKLLSFDELKHIKNFSDEELLKEFGHLSVYKIYDWKENFSEKDFFYFLNRRIHAILNCDFDGTNNFESDFLDSKHLALKSSNRLESFIKYYDSILAKINARIILLDFDDDTYRIFVIRKTDFQFFINNKSDFWSFKPINIEK